DLTHEILRLQTLRSSQDSFRFIPPSKCPAPRMESGAASFAPPAHVATSAASATLETSTKTPAIPTTSVAPEEQRAIRARMEVHAEGARRMWVLARIAREDVSLAEPANWKKALDEGKTGVFETMMKHGRESITEAAVQYHIDRLLFRKFFPGGNLAFFELFRDGIDLLGDHLPNSKEYDEYLISQKADMSALRKIRLDRSGVWAKKREGHIGVRIKDGTIWEETALEAFIRFWQDIVLPNWVDAIQRHLGKSQHAHSAIPESDLAARHQIELAKMVGKYTSKASDVRAVKAKVV
ncbi:hypothetical protein B0T16DRAFT_509199, partial [Cercophora newfieldiana]